MSREQDLPQRVDIPDEVKEAAKLGSLILFVGAGVSRLLGLPSWEGLANSVLRELRNKRFINFSELDQLMTLDPKKQLSIASAIAKENHHNINYPDHLKVKENKQGIYGYINNIGCCCVTTNYDELLEPKFSENDDGSTTTPKTTRVIAKSDFRSKLLDEPGTVVHLHGCVSDPSSMVVTTKDYLEHYDDKNVQAFLGQLFSSKTVVFLGYGLEEAEILEHILRRGGVDRIDEKKRFLLQGFFLSQKPLYNELSKYYKSSFGVNLLGFCRDHHDHSELENIIRDWVAEIDVQKPKLKADVDFMEEVLKDG